MTHGAMDDHVKRDLGKNIINYDRDPSLFFPYVSLPLALCGRNQTPKDALEDIFKMITDANLYLPAAHKWNFREPTREHPAEEIIPEFFNSVITATYSRIAPTTPGTVWYQHSSTLLEGIRKPDVILVRTSAHRPYKFRDVYTYCELKRSFTGANVGDALCQLSEIAGYATAAQINRRFYVASSLCDRKLTLALFARGATVISKPLDIDEEPLRFLAVLIGLSSADATWNGFDPNMAPSGQNTFRIHHFGPILQLDVSNLLLFASKAMHGRGTKVPLCQAREGPAQDARSCALKMSWLPGGSTTDIEINTLMETREPHPLQDGFEAELFGENDEYGIFRDCIKPPITQNQLQWNYERHLPGIPIVLACKRPQADNPLPKDALRAQGYYPSNHQPRMCPDTTSNILARFDVPMRDADGKRIPLKFDGKIYNGVPLYHEDRESIWMLYGTCGTSLAWFSCRRELLSGMMGAIAGHFNGLRMDVLHCDISDGNVMFEVESVAPHHAVPDWPKEKTGLEYPKRAGMLGDWGYAADLRSPEERTGRVTGTFPFMASELLSEKGRAGELYHDVRHDLESFFWVLWIVCVNMNGPFYERRMWKDDKEDVTKEALPNPHESGAAVRRSAAAVSPATPATPALDAQPPLWITPAASSNSDSRSTESITSSASGLVASTLFAVTQLDTKPLVDNFSRIPCDGRSPVPIWATPGVHNAGPDSVHMMKCHFPKIWFIKCLSPYFHDSGDGFLEGLEELHQYFIVEDRNKNSPPITHKIFLDILKKMLDSIDPQKDRTSDEEIKQGRVRYSALLAQGGEQGIAISALDGPKIKGPASKSIHGARGSSSKRQAETGGSPARKRSKK